MNRWFISMVSDGEYIYWLTELKGHFYKMKIKDLTVEYIKPLGECITSVSYTHLTLPTNREV